MPILDSLSSDDQLGIEPVPVVGFAGRAPLRGGPRRCVLLVEDEAIVAMMLEDMLDEMGYAVIGPAMSVAGAMELLDSGPIDAAILDVNIGGDSSEPIARRLVSMAVPFAFATGYTSPPRGLMANVPLLPKPYSQAELKGVMDGFFA